MGAIQHGAERQKVTVSEAAKIAPMFAAKVYGA